MPLRTKGPVIFFYWEGLGGNIPNFQKKFKAPTFEKENKFKFKTPLPTLFKNQIKMSVADLCSKGVLSKPYDLFKKYKQTVSQRFCSTRH
jgi:hypothetical protein